MVRELRSLIQKGHTFCISSLKAETITTTSDLLKPEAERRAVEIATKKNYPVVMAMFKDGNKGSGWLRLMNAETFGINDQHPQFVRQIAGSPFCLIRSEKTI